MADPFTIGLLLVAFAKSFVERAGSRSADLVFDALGNGRNSAADPQLETRVVAQLQSSPAAVAAAAQAINDDVLNFPADANRLVSSAPGLLESFLGISSSQGRAQRGRCPVGDHWILTPPTYLLPDGSSISPLTTFGAMRRQSPLMRARCSRGHVWLVFPITA